MDRQRDSPLDLSGMLAVALSVLTVALVIAAAITDRSLLLAAAAAVALAAVVLVMVRRSADRRSTSRPNRSDGADATDSSESFTEMPGSDGSSADPIHGEDDDNDDGDQYRADAIAARADLLATLRHGFSADHDQASDATPDRSRYGPSPPVDDHEPADGQATPVGSGRDYDPSPLLDPITGLFTQEFFEASLPKRVSAARRGLRPLSVAAVRVVEGRPVAAAPAADPTVVAEAMLEALREADTVAVAEDGTFLVLLEDTPEVGAVWTLERLRRRLNEGDADHTMWAGVSCYPAYSFEADGLISQAKTALSGARQWHQDRIEIAIGSPD